MSGQARKFGVSFNTVFLDYMEKRLDILVLDLSAGAISYRLFGFWISQLVQYLIGYLGSGSLCWCNILNKRERFPAVELLIAGKFVCLSNFSEDKVGSISPAVNSKRGCPQYFDLCTLTIW